MTAMTSTSPDFWTRLARKYARRPIGDMQSYEATLARTRSYLGAEDEVLELGAGTSSTAIRLAPHVRRYVSSDYAAGMVEIGRERAWEASIPSLNVVQGGLGDGAIGAGPYDRVLAFNLLHLLPELDLRLRDISGLLEPGGLFISKTPCLVDRFHLFRLMIGTMQLFGKAPYVEMFSSAALERRIAAAGFEIVEAGTYPRRGRSRYIVARKL